MVHRVDKFLLDIRISCEEIIEFCASKGLQSLRSNRMLQLALEREFEIIGEALLRMERLDLARLESKIPEYRKIIDFRNPSKKKRSHQFPIIQSLISYSPSSRTRVTNQVISL